MTVDTTGLREQVAKKQGGGGKTIREIIEFQKPQIARALPKIVSPDRFTRLVLTELQRTPKLNECSAASLLGALMYAAGLGVEPGPLGHAYLVPFGQQVTFILGYKGMLELARRSGEIRDIQAREVHENDYFKASYGLPDDVFLHEPAEGDRGQVIKYYVLARYKNGGHNFLVMTTAEIEKRRARSKAKNNGPWVTDYDAMAKKTVVRAISPFLPLSPEIASAIEQDEVQVMFDPDAQDEPLEITEMHDESPPEGAPPALAGGGGVVDVGVGQPDAVGVVSEASPAPASTTETPNVIINRDSDATVEELAGERPPPDNYDRLTAVELEEELRKRHLPMSGNRDVKAERLREHDRELEAPM